MRASPESHWHRRARLTALRRNFALALAAFLPAAVITSVLAAIALLILRQRGEVPPAYWPLVALAFLLAAAVAAFHTRRKFFTLTDAFTQLDVALHLHNRLTSAADGIGKFPPPRPAPDGFTWRWQPIATALAASAITLLLAAWIPVSKSSDTFRPTQPPTSWTDTQTWAERLAESEIVEPEAVEELEEKLDALRDQPAEDWFSHSSLEAGDTLRDQTAESIRALERDLTTATNSLTTAADDDSPLTDSDLQQLDQRFDQSLTNLQLGNLPLNPELLDNLKNLDLSQVRQLSPEQFQRLQQRLESGIGACQASLGPGEGGGEKLVDGNLLTPGTGDVTRGPGTGPVGRTAHPTDLGGGVPQPISNPDLTRALPAETLALATGEHDEPSIATSPIAGGAITSTGEGGDAIWRTNLTPAERATLQRFFK